MGIDPITMPYRRCCDGSTEKGSRAALRRYGKAAIALQLRLWILSGQMQRRPMTASDWGRSVGWALPTVCGCRYPTLGDGRDE